MIEITKEDIFNSVKEMLADYRGQLEIEEEPRKIFKCQGAIEALSRTLDIPEQLRVDAEMGIEDQDQD